MSSQEIVRVEDGQMVQNFMPVMDVGQAVERYNQVLAFTQKIMKEGKDFGKIPGVDKPSLLKPGAEKLCSFFGLTAKFAIVERTEEWSGAEPFFYYWYKCQLWRGPMLIAEGEGSCNSRESKYRYRWVQGEQLPPHLNKEDLLSRETRAEEFSFSVEKAETGGKYGKPAAYWQAFRDAIESDEAKKTKKKTRAGKQFDAWEIASIAYRVPNPDIADQVNTLQKMSQKRALIAATLIACNASEYFTQDIEDMGPVEGGYDAEPHGDAPGPAPKDQNTGGQGEPPGNISEAQTKRLYAIAKHEGGMDTEKYREFIHAMGYKTDKQIPREEYENVCERAKIGGQGVMQSDVQTEGEPI